MDSYNRFYLQLCLTLAACGLRAWTVGYHPTQRAEVLPLIPQNRAEALDRYFKEHRRLRRPDAAGNRSNKTFH